MTEHARARGLVIRSGARGEPAVEELCDACARRSARGGDASPGA